MIGLQARATIRESSFRFLNKQNPFEFIFGERKPLNFGDQTHQAITRNLFEALNDFTEHEQLGTVFEQTPFVLLDPNSSAWITASQTPDVSFYAGQDLKGKMLYAAPALAVEVVLPTDTYINVDDKIIALFEHGVQIVWLVIPHRRVVKVFSSDSDHPITLTSDNILTGGDLLPDFQLAVRDIFAVLTK